MVTIEENKKLIEEFPFLLPRNRFFDNVPANYDYSYTELDNMPEGWRKAFGIEMCKEIKAELLKYDYLNDYRILEIKEKYGGLRWYSGHIPSNSSIFDIIHKYETLSFKTCINCGRQAEYISEGWISPYCKTCKELDEKNSAIKYIPLVKEELKESFEENATK